MQIINIEELYVFFEDLNVLLKEGDFNKVKDKTEIFFNNVRTLINLENFKTIINESKFNKNQKEIIIDYYENGKAISDILSFKIANFSFSNIEKKEKTDEFLQVFENQIFTKDFYKKINESIEDFDIKNNILDSIMFIRDSILPNAKAEVCARFYVYIISDNLRNDLIKDVDFRKSISEKRSDFQSKLVQKIASHMEFWKIDHNKSNDVNVTIKKQYPNYSFFGFNEGDLDGGLRIVTMSNTPAGFFDVVMKSPDRKKTYIARVTNNRPESDIYNHLNKRLVEESAISAMLNSSDEDIILLDFCKGHSELLIKKFTGNDIDEKSLKELKKIFDIILHKGVSEITGFNPIIIQLGDKKYDIEQEEFLDLSLRMTTFMKNDNLNFDNKFIMDILQKNTEWLTMNLMKNIDFYSDENINKCKKYLQNIYEITNNNSIIKSQLDKEIDHLEGKLNNLEISKIKLEVDLDRERILRRISYLEENDVLSYLSNDDIQESTRLRNIFVDDLSNLSYVLIGDGKDLSSRPLSELKYLVNARNAQYDLFDSIFVTETMNREKASPTSLKKIRINDPLLKILYETKDNLNLFQNECSINVAEKLKSNFYDINQFLNKKGNVYDYFNKKDSFTMWNAFDHSENWFETGCNFNKNVKLLDNFIEEMPEKIEDARRTLNKEKEKLQEELKKNLEIRNKLLKKEPIDPNNLPKTKRVIRLKH